MRDGVAPLLGVNHSLSNLNDRLVRTAGINMLSHRLLYMNILGATVIVNGRKNCANAI
jgi:hypothetical protein